MKTGILKINTHNNKEILLKKIGQKEYQMKFIDPGIISLKLMMNLNIDLINFLIQKSKCDENSKVSIMKISKL